MKKNESYSKNSPGGKASIVLKMLLKKERLKNKIIIIDQPEDSLDNILISDWLVKNIRDIKFSNQLIIVTHNANVVINGDAQNIIVPNRYNNTIQYLFSSFESLESHSLNDEEKTIFQHAISILEGGKKELFKRTDKWSVSIIEGVNLNDIKSKMIPRKPNS